MKVTIKDYCENGLKLAESEIAVERLAGNIVKEEHWKGQASAYRAMLIALPELDVVPHSATSNNRILQFPQDCKGCFFQHKCKGRSGVDFAYGGLECTEIWKLYRRKQQHA